jgi:hypothetical protein
MLINKQKKIFVFLILTLLLFAGCQRKPAFHYNFETEDTLDTLPWKCKTIFSLSDKHTTSGQKCLKMELYPSPYPGITLNNFKPVWSKHNRLKFDIFNQAEAPLHLTIRIDDIKNPSYNNRYNHTIVLNPGMNHISIPLNSLVTTGTGRKINLANVQQVILFLVQPDEKRTVFLDDIRLE